MICHALPSPIDRRLGRWIVALLIVVVGIAALAGRFGNGANVLQRLASAWVLIAAFASAAAYLLGRAVSKRP